MHPDVTALLEVQKEDSGIYEVDGRIAALKPRLEEMDRERSRQESGLARAREALRAEERKHSELRDRVEQSKAQLAKHEAALDQISNMKQATAATAQLEQSRRTLADIEREYDLVGRRMAEMRRDAEEREAALGDLLESQGAERGELESQRASLEAELAELTARRNNKARQVPRSLLGRYDRIRSRKREHTVVPLRGSSCSHCDTMIPLQRRSAMFGSGLVEVCEGCGVLLYATD